ITLKVDDYIRLNLSISNDKNTSRSLVLVDSEYSTYDGQSPYIDSLNLDNELRSNEPYGLIKRFAIFGGSPEKSLTERLKYPLEKSLIERMEYLESQIMDIKIKDIKLKDQNFLEHAEQITPVDINECTGTDT
ncbi:15747_t:CDS:2, partial [Dentiscutata erythropus]